MDRITAAQRSHTMSRIRSRNTKPELLVRRFLYAQGFRYRLNVRTLPGTPDIVLRKYRTAIFVHGCFWHNHSCMKGRMPSTNANYWSQKIERNQQRDVEVCEKFSQLGWYTLTVWECQLKPKIREKTLNEIVVLLNKALIDRYKPNEYEPNQDFGIAAEPTNKYGKESNAKNL